MHRISKLSDFSFHQLSILVDQFFYFRRVELYSTVALTSILREEETPLKESKCVLPFALSDIILEEEKFDSYWY
jgi:hypothetical protein